MGLLLWTLIKKAMIVFLGTGFIYQSGVESVPVVITENKAIEKDFSAYDIEENFPKPQSQLTNKDIFKSTFSPEEENGVLVICASFSDGIEVDREAFEDLFLKEYDSDNYLRSVGNYFEYNSYGRHLLDFSFAYYDCEMTSSEAWHYVNDENEYGDSVGNDFMYQIFDELKNNGQIDSKSLDKNQDGYIDAVLFVFCETPTDGCYIYGAAAGQTSIYEYEPDVNSPVPGNYVKLSYDYMTRPLTESGNDSENTRIVIHEIGHLFGLLDYYDWMEYEGNFLSTLGIFDMQENNQGDWNAFSKFSCGWLNPYVISEDVDSVTLKLRCSELYDDAILIPTSKGWNGTAFDEYLLIDLIAKEGADGFDWQGIVENAEHIDNEVRNPECGVRITHVDARLVKETNGEYEHIDDLVGTYSSDEKYEIAFGNSNGWEPKVDTDSRFYHLIDIVPSDGTSKFRMSTPLSWAIFTPFSANDLFSEGEVFSMETHGDSFANGNCMNNGGTLDYIVTVDCIDEINHEAVITIKHK